MADNANNAVPSWREAYQTAMNQPVASNASDTLSSLAFRNILNKSAVPVGSSVPKSGFGAYVDPQGDTTQGRNDAAFDAAMQKGGLDAVGAIGGKIYNTPVIKQVLDALSGFTYAGANVADDALTGIDKVGQGDLGGLLDIAASPLSGIGKGAMAATGNANEVKTWSDVIAHGQRDMGLDPEDGLNKTIAGIGGFVGDVALDPTTYLTVGGTALAKGAAMGLKEGGKAAAEVATKAVKDAGEVGGSVAPRLQEIADNADNAGFLNRFTQAKGQAAARYADYKAANGGKAVGFQFPFAKSANPKDAEAIDPTQLNTNVDDQLAGLVPKEAATVGADGRKLVPNDFKPDVPVKTPEVLAEEKTIADGLTEAAKPIDKPITNDPKPVDTAVNPDEILAQAKHENMTDILNNVQFSKQAYDPETLVNHAAAHEGSIDKTLERDVEVPTPSPEGKGKVDVQAMIARIQRASKSEGKGDDIRIGTIKFGGKQVHPRVIATAWDKAVTNEQKIAVLKRIDPAFADGFRATPEVPKPATEKVTETVPGTPIDFNDPKLSGIKPEHHGLSPEELKGVRSATRNVNDMVRYINNDATDSELVHMAEKLGLSKSAPKKDIRDAFKKEFADWKKRNIESAKAATAAKAEAKTASKDARQAVGVGNQETAHLIDKVPVEQTLIRRATRAIEANHQMSMPLTKINYKVGDKKVAFKPELVSHRDVELLPKNAMEAGLKRQASEDLPITMDSGAKSDTPNPQTGIAIHPDKWGTQSIVAMHQSAITGITDIAKQYLEKTGERMPVFSKMELYKRTMQASMANLRAMGIAPYLDLGRAAKATHGVNLGIDDLTDILFKDMETRFFAGKTQHMQPQAFATGVEALVRAKIAGKSEADIVADIMHAFTGDRAIYRGPYKDADNVMRNGVSDKIVGRIRGVSPEGEIHQFGMEAAIRAGVSKDVPYAKAKANYLAGLKATAERWTKSDTLYQNLNNRMIVNAKEHGAELGAMVDRVSEETLAKIMAKANSGISMGDFMQEMEKTIKDGKAALGEEDSTKYMLWETEMHDLRAKVMKEPEQRTAKTASKVAKLAEDPKSEEAIKVENTKNVDDATEEAKQAGAEEASVNAPGASPDIVADLYDVRSGAISLDAWRRIHPIESFFSTRFGLDGSGMSRAMGTGLHTQVRMQSIFHGGVLNYLAKNPDKLMEDWKLIQNEGLVHVKGLGKDHASFVPSTDSAKQLYDVVNSVFDVSKNNIITRNGILAKHWNSVAEAKGLKLTMDPEKSILENSRAWMEHEGLKETKDVLEFLSKAHAVSTNITNDIAIASNFARTFGSATPKEGHALLAWSKRGINKNKTIAANEKSAGFFDLLPKTVYYSTDASRDIANIHRILNESRSIKPEGMIGSFMNNVFNPITNIMKASQTIVRPGHWVNNTLGDIMRNYLAGVSSLTPYRHSIAMMKANGKEMKAFGDNPLEAYKWHKATTNGEFEVHGRGDGIVIHVGGKPQKISYESMYRLMQDGPIMPAHHGGGVAEDFMHNADPSSLNRFGNALEGIQHKVLDNDTFSLNNLAATRDNFSRTAMAIDHAMKGKFKDVHELKASMEEQVLKWIPTSTDFTAKEAKYVRPAFMYYTWLRGITPRIVDTLMNKPGVALVPQKALYEAAKANGIDPVSLGNPFPPNAQMPSYYYDNVIGPLMQGEGQSLWGINFANPVTDVMDQLGAGVTPGGLMNGSSELNMGKTVLGAVSPFAKIPVDLATQTANGVPITDPGQYLQDSLTGSYGGLLSKMTGKNIDGSGRTDTANGPAHGVAQSDVAALQIANFLSGLKITDYNSPAAQRSYVGEQKAKFSTAKADYRRNQSG